MEQEKKSRKHGDARRGKITSLYRIYHLMKGRCNNPNKPDYKWYGAKGIRVCEEWSKSYLCFKEWALANGYKEGLTIDRIDSDGNYEPNNCRWVDMVVQNNNKKNVPKYEFNGEEHSISEWARILGVSRELLRDRITRLGWSVEKAFSTPRVPDGLRENNVMLNYNGETHPIGTWEKILGFKPEVIRKRIKNGWPIEKALTTPVKQKTKKE